jgi:hypothetical protein
MLASAVGAEPLAPGSALPPLRGELLTGRDAELRALAHGRTTLVAFGFTRRSSKDVEAWVGRFRKAYGADTTTSWFEVPLMGSGVARMMKPVIQGGMRNGTPEPDRAHVMTVWNGAREWKDLLAFREPNTAYLVLLDRAGHVRWRGTGPFEEARWKTLAAVADSIR